MDSPWTTTKKWIYKISSVPCTTGSEVDNLELVEEGLRELGEQGWEVYQVEKERIALEEYKGTGGLPKKGDYRMKIYCKKEKT